MPSFSPPVSSINLILNRQMGELLAESAFSLGGALLMRCGTLGQWFVSVLIERVRRGVGAGIGLRTLLYCVAWCTRLVEDRDFARLETSAVMIKAWLLQSTCRDCVYKFLRELRMDYAFEY